MRFRSRRISTTIAFTKHSFRDRILVYALVPLVFVAACRNDTKPSAPKDKETEGPRSVTTQKVEFKPMERTITVTGSFFAREQSTLSVKVPGPLETMSVDIGSAVKKGDRLAQIDRKDYELRVRQAKATLAQARARLGLSQEGDQDDIDPEKTPPVQQAKAVLEEATRNRERVKQLTKEKIAAQSELDTVEAAYRVALGKYQDSLQDVRERQALLVQRRVEVSQAEKQLVDTTIYAPFDGIIQQRRASPGEFLEIGTPLLTIAAVDPLRLHLEIPERESTQVAPGQPIRIRVEGNTNPIAAHIDRVSPMLSETNRMLIVESDVASTPGLKPGLFAQAEIVISTNDPALVIPESAITSFVGLEKAFVVAEGKALEKSISTGRRRNGVVEIRSGLKQGDIVILNPSKIRSGQTVVQEGDAKAR